MTTRLCPHCDKEISAAATFCGYCGSALTTAPQPEPEPKPEPKPQREPVPRAVAAAGSRRRWLVGGLIVVILGAGGTVGALLLTGGDDQPEAAPTTSAAPVSSTTTAASPTTTAAPATTASPPSTAPTALPDFVAATMLNPRIARHDTLTEQTEHWTIWGLDIQEWDYVQDHLEVTSDGDAGATLASNDGIAPGTAVLYRFAYEGEAGLHAGVSSGTWEQPDFRSFGLRMGAEWQDDAVISEHWEGDEEFSGFVPVDGTLDPEAGTVYYALITVEHERFSFWVWPDDGSSWASDVLETGPDWDRPLWTVDIGTDVNKVNVYEAWIIEFDGLQL